jgi:hypothetical protein
MTRSPPTSRCLSFSSCARPAGFASRGQDGRRWSRDRPRGGAQGLSSGSHRVRPRDHPLRGAGRGVAMRATTSASAGAGGATSRRGGSSGDSARLVKGPRSIIGRHSYIDGCAGPVDAFGQGHDRAFWRDRGFWRGVPARARSVRSSSRGYAAGAARARGCRRAAAARDPADRRAEVLANCCYSGDAAEQPPTTSSGTGPRSGTAPAAVAATPTDVLIPVGAMERRARPRRGH